MTSPWEFGFVLPNLVLPVDPDLLDPSDHPNGISLAPEYLSIVRNNDPRVLSLRASEAAVEQILGSFYDEHHRPYEPAVLLINKAAPDAVRKDLHALVAFRNAIALSFILRARAAAAKNGNNVEPSWSDTFDFHPAQVNTHGRMVIQSPALLSLVSESARLNLSHSPYIQLAGRRLWADNYLWWAFGRTWRRRFLGKARRDQFADRLFRSLEAAFQACAVGNKNEGSLAEYGTQVAIWVSAIEILAWPARKHADLESVLSLLERYPARTATRQRRYQAKVGRTSRRLNSLQRAYTYMYRARNRFLHGNPIHANTLLTLSQKRRVGLPLVAALVYRAALVAYLDTRHPKQITTLRQLSERASEMFDDHSAEHALAELFGYAL